MKEIQNNNEKQENTTKTQINNKRGVNKGWIAIFISVLCVAVISSLLVLRGDKKDIDAVEYGQKQNQEYCDLYDEATFKTNLSKFKDFGQIDVTNSPILGLKQIAVKSTGEIFYANNAGDVVIVGVMLDTNGKNLTKEAVDKINQIKFKEVSKSIDKSLAIKIGNGKHELIAFTDPDCGYCRAAESMFKENADKLDVTKYIFFTPLDSIHPEAAAKTVHILCSTNPAEELEKVMRNEITEFPNQCEEGKAKLAKHREIGAILGVNGTPTFYIDGVRYVGANPEIIEKISKK